MKEKALRSYIELKSDYASVHGLVTNETGCGSISSCSGDSCDDGGGGE